MLRRRAVAVQNAVALPSPAGWRKLAGGKAGRPPPPVAPASRRPPRPGRGNALPHPPSTRAAPIRRCRFRPCASVLDCAQPSGAFGGGPEPASRVVSAPGPKRRRAAAVPDAGALDRTRSWSARRRRAMRRVRGRIRRPVPPGWEPRLYGRHGWPPPRTRPDSRRASPILPVRRGPASQTMGACFHAEVSRSIPKGRSMMQPDFPFSRL